jgi:hypothetical protein
MSERAPHTPREYLSTLLSSLIPRVVRAGWAGGVMFLVGIGLTSVWALSTPRLYRSEAVIGLERGVQSVNLGGEGETPRTIAGRLHDMLTSRPRLEGAIREMKLYPKIVDHRSVGDAIDEMNKHIIIGGREGNTTYRVSYDAPGRELAQRVLDWLLKGVVEEDGQRRIRETEETRRFLDAERAHVDEDLKNKEGALSAFLTKHPQLAAEAGGAAAMGGLIRAADRAPAAGGGGEIAALELQAAQLEEALVTAGTRPAPGISVLPNGAPGDPALTVARERAHVELQEAQRDLTEKQSHFTNEHPDVKAALRRVAGAEAALRRADAALQAQRTTALATAPAAGPTPAPAEDENPGGGRAAAIRRALAAVHSQIAAVKSRGGNQRPEVAPAPGSAVAIDTEWVRLNRDVTETRERQAQLEAKQFQAQLMATLAGGGQGGRLVILDPPFRPTRPVAGERSKIVLAGGAVSLILSVLVILLFAAFDDRLYDPRDIQRIVSDGIVIVVPRIIVPRLTGKSG